MPGIPSALVCRILGGLLDHRARSLEERARGGRRGSSPRAAGQSAVAQEARQDAGRMFVLASKVKGEIDPDVLGDLCALAMGHAAAREDLVEILREIHHPRLAQVVGSPGPFGATAEAIIADWPQGE